MPAISTSPMGGTCSKCLVTLEDESLKCDRCKASIHLRCSDLPSYMLLRFKTSQAGYVCRTCVLVEGDPESLKENQEKIDLIIKKEEEVITIAANDCESKSSDSVIKESQINQESLIQQSNINKDKTEKK